MLQGRWIFLLIVCLPGVGCSRPPAAPPTAEKETPPDDETPSKLKHLSSAARVEIDVEKYPEGGKKTERVVRRGVDGEAIAHGRFTSWHPNGQKHEDGSYFNGLKSGVWEEWNESGQMLWQGSYREGEKDGRWVTFPDPKTRQEEDYRDGVLRAQRFYEQDETGAFSVKIGSWREWHDPPPVEPGSDPGKAPPKRQGPPKSEKHFVKGKENGVWHVWNASGQELEIRSYKQGQPDGVWREFHGPDRPKSLREFRGGKPHGKETVWFADGQKEEEGDYADGVKHGVWTNWLPNTQKTKEVNYEHGKLHGKVTEWYLGQQVWYEGQYDQDQKAGDWTTWYKAEPNKKEQKRSIERYRGGQPDGVWEYWYPNGQLERHEEYAVGKPAGKWKSFYENGQQLAETDFVDGLPDGVHIRWTPEGKKAAVEVYQKGSLVNVQGGQN